MQRNLQNTYETIEEGGIDRTVCKVNNFRHLIVQCDGLGGLAAFPTEVHDLLATVLNILSDCFPKSHVGYQAGKVFTESRGRPSYVIPKEQLELFIELGFHIPEMANMLGVCAKTVQRRLKDYGLSITDTYSNISNETLDSQVNEILQMFPNCGYRRM